jgi:hypothetical protein
MRHIDLNVHFMAALEQDHVRNCFPVHRLQFGGIKTEIPRATLRATPPSSLALTGGRTRCFFSLSSLSA